MVTRAEDGSAPYPYINNKRKREETAPSTSCRFEVTGTRHVVVESFNGMVYVKIREYVQRKDKGFWSSPRGINLRVEEWRKFVEMMPAINEAVNNVEVSTNFSIFFFPINYFDDCLSV